MAVFKCKTCGGDILPNADGYTGVCEYCGTVQTLPKDKDEKIGQILNRANDFRLSCDYDRAIFEYEKVLELDETEPEAHWGIFLSRYGVEYVKDTMTLAYKPTLHRISSVSVYDDVDYRATLKYASFSATEQYKTDADQIEMVMKELLLLSANQESYDIFLSYKELDDVIRQRTDDSYLAHDLYNELSARGYKVFFAPKSLIGVALYEPKIYSAIISSKVMIVLGTKPQYLEGVWVKNEWSRFAEAIENGEDKVLIPVFKNMEASQLPSRIAKYQAYNMASMTFLPSLLGAIEKCVKRDSKIDFNKNASAEDAFIERGFLAIEDREYSKADSFFENALNLNPHSSQAYFGKLMVEMKVNKKEQILTSAHPLKTYKNFEKAVRFADQQLKTVLLQYEEKVQNTLDEQEYNKAIALINKGKPSESDYEAAAKIFGSISGFKDAKEKERLCLEKIDGIKKDAVLSEAKSKMTGEKISNCEEAIKLLKSISGWKDADETLEECEKRIEKILSTKKMKKRIVLCVSGIISIVVVCSLLIYTLSKPMYIFNDSSKVLLMSDGTIIATGIFGPGGDCDVSDWKNIVAVSADSSHIVGLKSDGTVVAMGDNDYNDCGQCDVEDWTDIVDVSAGYEYTVGLKSDGTVVAVGDNDFGQCDVSGWSDIVSIATGSNNTYGLKSNGTVVATKGYNYYGQADVEDWTDIVAISANLHYTFGLKKDGTVVSTKHADGDESCLCRCNVSGWTDVVGIAAGTYHVLGLKADGTVVASGDEYLKVCDIDNWNDIVAISAKSRNSVGLKLDGTIVYAGNNVKYECDDYVDEDIVSVYIR